MSTNDTISRASVIAAETTSIVEAFQIIQELRDKFGFDGFEVDASDAQEQVERALSPTIDFFDINDAPDVLPDLDATPKMTEDFADQLAAHVVRVAFDSYGLAEGLSDFTQSTLNSVIEDVVEPMLNYPENFSFDVTLYDRKGDALVLARNFADLDEAHRFGVNAFDVEVSKFTDNDRSQFEMVKDARPHARVDNYMVTVSDENGLPVVSLTGRF